MLALPRAFSLHPTSCPESLSSPPPTTTHASNHCCFGWLMPPARISPLSPKPQLSTGQQIVHSTCPKSNCSPSPHSRPREWDPHSPGHPNQQPKFSHHPGPVESTLVAILFSPLPLHPYCDCTVSHFSTSHVTSHIRPTSLQAQSLHPTSAEPPEYPSRTGGSGHMIPQLAPSMALPGPLRITSSLSPPRTPLVPHPQLH